MVAHNRLIPILLDQAVKRCDWHTNYGSVSRAFEKAKT